MRVYASFLIALMLLIAAGCGGEGGGLMDDPLRSIKGPINPRSGASVKKGTKQPAGPKKGMKRQKAQPVRGSKGA